MGTDQEKVEKSMEKTIETNGSSIRQEYTFASDVELKECKYCRVMIPKKATICPNCKTALKSHMLLKTIAAVLILAVIAAGGYWLFVYRGMPSDSVVTTWEQQDEVTASVVSVNTVETAEAAAGARTVEPAEVAAEARTVEFEQFASVAESAKAEGVTGVEEMQNEEAEPAVESTGLKDEDTRADQSSGEDNSAEDDESGIENEGSVEDGTDNKAVLEEEKVAGDTSDKEDKSDSEDKNAVEDNDTAENQDTTEDEGTEEAKVSNSAIALKDIGENEAAFRAECEQRKYKSLLRDEEYLETAVLVTEVEVVCQIDGGLFDENIYYLCREEENGNECYYIIRDDREEDETLILEGDIITVYGQLFGTCKIPANLIEARPTVPAISMISYDLLGE